MKFYRLMVISNERRLFLRGIQMENKRLLHKAYSEEFKLDAVCRIETSDCPTAKIAAK